MKDDELLNFDPRDVCFRLARIILILAGTVLATELLFPPVDRNFHVIGGMTFLLCSAVFSMVITRPRRKPCPPKNDR